MRRIDDIIYSDYDECKLDLYLPDGKSFEIFIYYHGGGIESGDKADPSVLFAGLVDSGVAVASVNYRMYPSAGYPDFLEDAADAVKWVMDNIGNYGECTGLYVGGSSAGGYISMMLCFDKSYLARRGIDSDGLSGYIFDAGQPTTHFNVLRERGLDTRRVIVDSAAPLYHICENPNAAPMLILVSDNDMTNRLEQTHLLCSTLRHFGYPEDKIVFKLMEGFSHCAYINALNVQGDSILAEIIIDFMRGKK